MDVQTPTDNAERAGRTEIKVLKKGYFSGCLELIFSPKLNSPILLGEDLRHTQHSTGGLFKVLIVKRSVIKYVFSDPFPFTFREYEPETGVVTFRSPSPSGLFVTVPS